MVDFIRKLTAVIPTRPNEKVYLPKVRKQALMVRRRRRRSHTTVFVWVNSLFVSGNRRGCYGAALRRASAGCDHTFARYKDLQVSACCKERAPCYNSHRGDSGGSWITGEGNGIVSSNLDGSRATGKS